MLFFLLKIALAIWSLLWFHTNFRIFFYFYEYCHWNFDRDILNCYITLVSTDVLTVVILIIHEHRISSFLFVSSSVSSINILKFSMYRCFTSFIQFISKSSTSMKTSKIRFKILPEQNGSINSTKHYRRHITNLHKC